jgi:hypothetical protein
LRNTAARDPNEFALTQVLCKPLDTADEVVAHRRHQRGRGEVVAAVPPPEVRDAALGLQDRHVEVQLQAIDALDRQGDMLTEDLRRAACYRHGWLRSSEATRPPSRLERFNDRGWISASSRLDRSRFNRQIYE